ncbi:hypothetical protein ACFQHO_00200 [Actinomadura yumaensis]|uniref:hypothetical protein n=1 Tax=Actinomadura yumaensis TaxID=111807 RepID=UPI00361E0985
MRERSPTPRTVHCSSRPRGAGRRALPRTGRAARTARVAGAPGRPGHGGELSAPPGPMLTRLLFSALCEAAMTAGADPDPAGARRAAAEALHAILAGLRREPPAP